MDDIFLIQHCSALSNGDVEMLPNKILTMANYPQTDTIFIANKFYS